MKAFFRLFFILFISACFYQQSDLVSKVWAKTKAKKRGLIGNPMPEYIPRQKDDFLGLKRYVEKQWALKDISFLSALEVVAENKRRKKIKQPVVAVVDTGIHAKHPCLKHSLWLNEDEIPNNGIDDDKNGFIDDMHGWNFVDNNNDIQDRHGHGTHVSGIIAARGKSLNLALARLQPQKKAQRGLASFSRRKRSSEECNMAGVAPQAKIMTLKYFDPSATGDNLENTVKSIKYAVDNGADIINYSGGGPGANSRERAEIAFAADKSIIFVAALGNESRKIGGKHKFYPASYELPNIVFLHSLNKQAQIIESSNRIRVKNRLSPDHEFYDIDSSHRIPISRSALEDTKAQSAPGEEILSTLPPGILTAKKKSGSNWRRMTASFAGNNNYGRMTGTSQATAVAAGVVALVVSMYPSWDMTRQIKQIVKTGFIKQKTDQIKKVTNQGKKLDAYRALIMKDSNLDFEDQQDKTNTALPHSSDPSSVLKNPKRGLHGADTYYNLEQSAEKDSKEDQFQFIQRIKETIEKQKTE